MPVPQVKKRSYIEICTCTCTWTFTCRQETSWVTGCDYMPTLRRVATCTERSVCLWDIRAKGKNPVRVNPHSAVVWPLLFTVCQQASSHVRLLVTLSTSSLPFSLLRSHTILIASTVSSNHLIRCLPRLLLPSTIPTIMFFLHFFVSHNVLHIIQLLP